MNLDYMAKLVANDQKAIDSQSGDTRKRVIAMGKLLRKMQKEQKKEQAETEQTWQEWCEAEKVTWVTFPSYRVCKQYSLISRYPGAYKAGMSIKEAYRQAGLWKRNGGSPPELEKKTQSRPLGRVATAASRAARKFDKLVEGNVPEAAAEQKWTNDEVTGSLEELVLCRQSCNSLIQQLRKLEESRSVLT